MVLFGLLLLAIPFILPIASLVSLVRVRRRLSDLEELVGQQQSTIDQLLKRLREREMRKEPAVTAPAAQAGVQAPPLPPAEAPSIAPPSIGPPPSPAPPAVVPRPAVVTPPAIVTPPPTIAPPPPTIAPPPPLKPATPSAADAPAAPVRREPPPQPPRPVPPMRPAPPPPPPPKPFDWEQLIGVKMFSAVAGVALVLAAVFFLKYSMDHGWLAPPVRVAIGILTGIALLVVCELKAARRYPVTANALDAAAIAILFATFFAAHALYQMIPASATFALLGLVTVVAVLLSIRRDSMFIALLGLVGGFATPILLSTGENRPISLFTYLLLLNIGLAWVASRKRWSGLTVVTVVLTACYQWGWVVKFLDVNQLSLAMGIFLVFGVTGFAAIVFGRRPGGGPLDAALDRVGLATASMPLLFAVYLAAVPAYGARVGMLFGFLLLIDAALLAVAIGRRDDIPHAVGGAATLAVFATWLSVSYASHAYTTVVAFASAFVVFFAAAPAIANRLGRPFEGVGVQMVLAAPMLLFVFVVIARIEPQAAAPLRLFGPLFALLAILAWRAVAAEEFAVYYVAAFFGVAAEAAWSATHLTADRLGEAIFLYAAFAVFYLGVPLIARKLDRHLQPAWGGGAVLIASLILLLFLAAGPRPAAAVWGLAILLALLNAGVFVESASGRLPMLALAGGALSWIVLAVWWYQAAATVGLLPSLLVLVMLTLIMLAGHAWAHARAGRAHPGSTGGTFGFRQGAFLGLIGHLFLFMIAQQPDWSLPPWPLFGALGVLTLAVSATSLGVGAVGLHAAGTIAAAVIVFAWGQTVHLRSYEWTTLIATEVVAAYAVGWIAIKARARQEPTAAAVAATLTLFIAELVLTNAANLPAAPHLAVFIATHVINLAILLSLAWRFSWPVVGPLAVAAAWFATFAWRDSHAAPAFWKGALAFAAALYAVFTAYPFVLGRRARESRDPFLTAVLGAAFFLFAARSALLQGGLGGYLGAVPVGEGLVMALLLRQLLRLEPAASRDLGRLALVAGAALAFATVAIPLQLQHQWITIGWALEGAALAFLYRRIPHRGLFFWAVALLAVVFVRLAFNPAVFVYEPRGYRVFNWYLYTYSVCAGSLILAAWWFKGTDDRIAGPLPSASSLFPAAGVILLFLLLNIEIADYYATGREITFRFGVTLAQDLTYTIGWLIFGMLLLMAGIYLRNRPARVAAVTLIAVTAFKAFLYDMRSLGGLYRVGSLVGLAISLSLVALALQKFVLRKENE